MNFELESFAKNNDYFQFSEESKSINLKIQKYPNLFKFYCLEIKNDFSTSVSISLSTKTLQESSYAKLNFKKKNIISNKNQNTNFNFNLIYELLIHIFEYCDGISLTSNLRVCRKWNIILSNNIMKRDEVQLIWKRAAILQFHRKSSEFNKENFRDLDSMLPKTNEEEQQENNKKEFPLLSWKQYFI